MLRIKKYGAIDIGSNAVRLLIANILEEEGKPTKFKKSSLVRVPIRLGADSFVKGTISEDSILRLQDAMNAFRLLMKTHKVSLYKACATSAIREASNANEVVDRIFENTQISIDVIDGEEEATIIAATDLDDYIDHTQCYLYIDVGGGSTEFSIIDCGKKVISKSFKIGTVRLLHDIVKQNEWNDLEAWINEHTKKYERLSVLGSGGNINKIYKLSGKKIGVPLTYFYLSSFYEKLQSYSYEERITELNLNQDRADVIIPAIRIYLSAMKWSAAKHIYVPKIGLSDGIIKSIYFNYIESNAL